MIVAFVRCLWAFFVRDLRLAASYRLQLLVQFASVVSLSFTFFFLSRMLGHFEGQIDSLKPYGGSYFGFALIGLAFSSYLDGALRSFSMALRQAQLTGTFSAMLAARAPLAAVVAGSAVYPMTVMTLRVAGFFAIGLGLFRLPVVEGRWGAALLVLALTLAVTLVLGIFAAGFVVRFKQGDPVTAALAALSWLLSGVVYPKEILPDSVQAFARLLPMTHSLEAMRLALLTHAPWSAFEGSLLYLSGFTAVGLPIAALWLRSAVRAAKKSGALAHY